MQNAALAEASLVAVNVWRLPPRGGSPAASTESCV